MTKQPDINEQASQGDWRVIITSKADKQIAKLPPDIAERLLFLLRELRALGPERKNWPHFGPLKGKKGLFYHCHLNKGKPRYVAIWEVTDLGAKLMEVRYAGTHENARYRKIN